MRAKNPLRYAAGAMMLMLTACSTQSSPAPVTANSGSTNSSSTNSGGTGSGTTTPPPPPVPAAFDPATDCGPFSAYGNTFACMLTGQIINGTQSVSGSTDTTNYAENMRFPLQSGPAYVNSLYYRYKNGGGFSTNWIGPDGAQLGTPDNGTAQCDSRNYSFPWQDNFCELRPGGNGQNLACPASEGHQGIDIRGPACGNNDAQNLIVSPVSGTIVEILPHYTKILSDDGIVYYNLMHMTMSSLTYDNQDIAAQPSGIPVTRGEVLGRIGNVQRGSWDTGAPTVYTPYHLHFEVRMAVYDDVTGELLPGVPMPPYVAALDAYDRLESGTP